MVTDADRPATVLSVQKYSTAPPAVPTTSFNDGNTVIPANDDVLATSKQEEWITKKKTELVTTKQIETRVKRQLVLEDGKVVEDSGPLVTTTTTEDTDKNESEQTERKEHSGKGQPGEGWVPISSIPEDVIVKEINEHKVTTHDEVEDILETEEIKHLGNVSSEKLVRAINEGSGNARNVFLRSDRNEMVSVTPYERDLAAQRRIIQQSRRHDRTTDIEDTKEVNKFNESGNMITEITKRHEHEDFHNEDIPDSDSDEFEHVEEQDGTHEYNHGKSENFVEYFSIPKGGPISHGIKIGEGARVVAENINSERHGDDDVWDSVSERIRKSTDRQEETTRVMTSRSDALTSRPLDFSQEEHTRKNETNRWLSSHFGSSSSSLNSESLPRSPRQTTPQGIHVTMTSRTSPIQVTPPPPPHPTPPKIGKRITFQDNVRSSPSPTPKEIKVDLQNRHENVMRSRNSQFGRGTVTKSGEDLWDESSTPTPPPRTRHRNSPDLRSLQTSSPSQGNMYLRKTDQEPYNLRSIGDTGERKSFERREESFGYTGSSHPMTSRDSFDSTNLGDGYVTKHNNYYKTTETNNPAQNELYENGQAAVTERKTVERRQQQLTYDGPSQKQFHPKFILGMPSSTIGRLKGIESTGATVTSESQPALESQTLPRRRFYFGDDEGSLGVKHAPLAPRRSGGYGKPKELRQPGMDDINVSISNNYNTEGRKSSSLSRSMSFTPSTLRDQSGNFEKRTETTTQKDYRYQNVYKSNPHLVDSADLQSPRLITSIHRSPRQVTDAWPKNESVYSNRGEIPTTRSKTSFLDNVKKSSSELYESLLGRGKGSSPARSMTPTRSYSPMNRTVGTRSPAGGGLTDDYQETYRMTSSTPENDTNQPRITTDTTSKFSRKTLRNDEGQPAGKVESSETTTRTKSRFKESEVMYPNGRRAESPLSSYRTPESRPQRTSGGSVVIPVKDSNNNKHVHYAK